MADNGVFSETGGGGGSTNPKIRALAGGGVVTGGAMRISPLFLE